MTKDELIAKLEKLEKENKDLRAKVDVLERRLYWERYYDNQLKPIPIPPQPMFKDDDQWWLNQPRCINVA